MATINTWIRSEVTINGVNYSFGDLVTPVQVTAASDSVHVQRVAIATGADAKIFDVSQDLSDFDYLYIVSDQTVELEIVVANNGSKDVVFVLPLIAGFPLVLPSDVSRDSDHTEDWGVSGTVDTMDKFTVSNDSGSTANVLIAVFT